MAYSDFTVSKVKRELGVTIAETTGLFAQVRKVEPSELLTAILNRSGRLGRLIGTEKAKSEFLIAPILAEVTSRLHDQVSLFSGTEFNVDVEKGLTVFCDFMLSQSPEQLDITAPIVTIVEAKNDNLKNGIGQCMAEMVAAQIFNNRAEKDPDGNANKTIYGVVTTGTSWLFMHLMGSHIQVDDREYFINEVDQLLGILMLPFQNDLQAIGEE